MGAAPPQGEYAQGSSGTFTVPTGGSIVLPSTTSAAATVNAGVTNIGLFFSGGNMCYTHIGACIWANEAATNLRLGSGTGLGWVNGAANSNVTDVGLFRAAASIVKVTAGGTANSGYGSLRAEWPRRVFGSHKTPGTGATLTAEGGCPTHTLTGTASNLSNSSGAYVLLSGDGTIAGVDIATTEVLKTELNPIATFVIRTGTTLPTDATERLWVGFASASLAAADSPTGAHVMAFRYAISADGTAFWRTVTNDGGADTGTVTISTIAIAAATRYVLTIDSTNPASITFYVNGALAATHATNLPTTTTALGTQCFALDAGAGVMELAISKIRVETD